MQTNIMSERLTLLTAHVAATATGILVRRGALQTHIEGPGIGEVFAVLQRLLDNAFLTIPEIIRHFAAPQQKSVTDLLRLLHSRRLLVSSAEAGASASGKEPEEPRDVFNWHFGLDGVPPGLRRRPGTIALIGHNRLSEIIARALGRSGVNDLVIVSDPCLNVPECSSAEPAAVVSALPEPPLALLIACSEFGGQHLLKPWNELAVREGIPFLAVLQENLVGTLGPLVIPRETPCLECLAQRQDSQLGDFKRIREFEKLSVTACANAYHPSMLHVLGETAAFETFLFVSGVSNGLIGHTTEINLLQRQVRTARVLKAPRCSVCSSVTEVALVGVEKSPGGEHAWADLAKPAA
jgi:bacteriocin biosynthesis cyclodehydratase domain-containing protein